MRHPACRSLLNTFDCARAIEGQLLAQHPHAARRAGDTLVLRLASGAVLRLVDEQAAAVPPRGPEAAAYSYFGRLARVPFTSCTPSTERVTITRWCT